MISHCRIFETNTGTVCDGRRRSLVAVIPTTGPPCEPNVSCTERTQAKRESPQCAIFSGCYRHGQIIIGDSTATSIGNRRMYRAQRGHKLRGKVPSVPSSPGATVTDRSSSGTARRHQ
eukprot:scpid104290/ scgid29215/ 